MISRNFVKYTFYFNIFYNFLIFRYKKNKITSPLTG